MKTITTIPDTDTVLPIVNKFIQSIQEDFLNKIGSIEEIKALFPLIFKKNAKHLTDKYSIGVDFGHFFLNLDNDSQADLLAYIGIKGAKDYPEIEEKYLVALEAKHPDIAGYGKKAAMYYWRQFLWFNGTLNKYQLYPTVLNVLQKFTLFTNNRGIVRNVDGFKNENYNTHLSTFKGKTFGNYNNWTILWRELGENEKEALLHHILHTYKG